MVLAPTEPFDLIIIGAGAAGLSVASGGAQLGLTVALVEAGEMGGDCLNAGCVPSKALLAAAKAAHQLSDGASQLGVTFKGAVDVNYAAVWRMFVGRLITLPLMIVRNDLKGWAWMLFAPKASWSTRMLLKLATGC